MKTKHTILITTNNLATNPRLVKELKTAIELDGTLTVVQFKLGNWSDEKSEQLGKEVIVEFRKKGVEELRSGGYKGALKADVSSQRIRYIHIDATKKNRWKWIKWGLLEKIARCLYPLLNKDLKINALANSRRSLQLLDACRKNGKPDLIVAHNLGALYPAYMLSKKWNIPFIFDVEDYHPGEFIRHDAKNEQQRREFLMKQLLPNALTITSASPLIGSQTLQLIGGHPKHQVILNSFPQDEFMPPKANSQQLPATNSLRLIWFSQKISFGRGLEQLFDALKILIDLSRQESASVPECLSAEDTNSHQLIASLTLTLIGDLDPTFNSQIIQPFIDFTRQPLDVRNTNAFQSNTDSYWRMATPIEMVVIPPLSQQELHLQLANHDVGLALEPGKDLNNKLAISNKIITYAQAGLYIMATDTPAQKEFMAQEPSRGLVCGQTAEEMASALTQMLNQRELIKENAFERFEKGKALAWENETEKLERIWSLIKKEE